MHHRHGSDLRRDTLDEHRHLSACTSGLVFIKSNTTKEATMKIKSGQGLDIYKVVDVKGKTIANHFVDKMDAKEYRNTVPGATIRRGSAHLKGETF